MEKKINIKFAENGDVEIECNDLQLVMHNSDKKIDAKELYDLLGYSVGDTYVLEDLPDYEGRSDNEKKLLEELYGIIDQIIKQIDWVSQLLEENTVDPIAPELDN